MKKPLEAYKVWGESLSGHLNGTLLAWDKEENRTWLMSAITSLFYDRVKVPGTIHYPTSDGHMIVRVVGAVAALNGDLIFVAHSWTGVSSQLEIIERHMLSKNYSEIWY